MYFTPSGNVNLGQSCGLPLCVMPLSSLRSIGQSLGRTFLNQVLFDAAPRFSPGFAYQMYPRRNLSSSVHHIRRHATSVCPIDDDIHLDNLVKMVFSTFVHYKVTIFPLSK